MENETMNGQLTVRPQHAPAQVPQFDTAQIDLIKRTVCKGATKDEFDLFIAVCKLRGLNPLVRQIYAIKRKQWNSQTRQYDYVMVHQTGIDGFRLIAERTHKYAGQEGPFFTEDGVHWTDAWIKSTPPKAAKVGIIRSDFKQTLWAMARFDAYCPRNDKNEPTGVWANIGEGQIAKCAEALGFRRAFPEELSGLYVHEEMQQAKGEIMDVVDETHAEVEYESAGPAEVAEEAKRPPSSAPGKCPSCGHALMVSKFNTGELYCNAKAGGCGKKFKATDLAAKEKPIVAKVDEPAGAGVLVNAQRQEVVEETLEASSVPEKKPITRGQVNLLRKRLSDAGLIEGEDTTKAIHWLVTYLGVDFIAYDDTKSGTENLDALMRQIDGNQLGELKDAIGAEIKGEEGQ